MGPAGGPPGAPQAPKSGPRHEKMWAVCSTTITKSIKINKTVAALKNNHCANITRYWPPAHCVRSKRDKWEKEYLFIQMQTFTDLLLKILRTLSCYFHQVQRRWKNINTQVWVEDNKVQFEHYRKPSANPLLMLEMSAMPANMKRSVLTQEVVTIMKNISPALPWSVTVKHLNKFSERMKASGYDGSKSSNQEWTDMRR